MPAGATARPSRKKAPQTFDPGAILFVVFGAAIAYFVAAVWPNLPGTGPARWITTAALFTAAALIGLAAVVSAWFGEKLHHARSVATLGPRE